jgi:predicted HTH domain antitoxin
MLLLAGEKEPYNLLMSEYAGRARYSVDRLVVDFPKDLLLLLAPNTEQAAAYLKQLALIELFRRGEVSSGYAANVLGMSRWDFIDLLAEHEVPYIDLSEEELRQEIEAAKPWRSPRRRPQTPTADG